MSRPIYVVYHPDDTWETIGEAFDPERHPWALTLQAPSGSDDLHPCRKHSIPSSLLGGDLARLPQVLAFTRDAVGPLAIWTENGTAYDTCPIAVQPKKVEVPFEPTNLKELQAEETNFTRLTETIQEHRMRLAEVTSKLNNARLKVCRFQNEPMLRIIEGSIQQAQERLRHAEEAASVSIKRELADLEKRREQWVKANGRSTQFKEVNELSRQQREAAELLSSAERSLKDALPRLVYQFYLARLNAEEAEKPRWARKLESLDAHLPSGEPETIRRQLYLKQIEFIKAQRQAAAAEKSTAIVHQVSARPVLGGVVIGRSGAVRKMTEAEQAQPMTVIMPTLGAGIGSKPSVSASRPIPRMPPSVSASRPIPSMKPSTPASRPIPRMPPSVSASRPIPPSAKPIVPASKPAAPVDEW